MVNCRPAHFTARTNCTLELNYWFFFIPPLRPKIFTVYKYRKSALADACSGGCYSCNLLSGVGTIGDMEEIKPFSSLCEPDVRQSFFVVLDSETGLFHSPTAEEMYAIAQAIKLHAGVPEEVRSHFATALNLLAYSWYCYPFNVTAQLMGYVSVEFALKVRYPSKTKYSFAVLAKQAVADGLIKDSGFSHIHQNDTERRIISPVSPIIIPAEQSYIDVLVKVMPSLRNSLAHGTTMLHRSGAQSVRICAEFINQLFPETENVS